MILRRPDNWHLHLRDGPMLAAVAPCSSVFGRKIAMPNLGQNPITTLEQAFAYLERIAATGLTGALGTCYLTDKTDPHELERGFRAGAWVAAKLYPANATTHSAQGVTDIFRLLPVFWRMSEIGMPLLLHGEVTDRSVDIFGREDVFIHRILKRLLAELPDLRVVLEHITTQTAVEFVQSRERNLFATITPHHLWWNRNALFDGGLRPHAYCLPVLKREEDRLALRKVATSGDPRFFAGTDSAPHIVRKKLDDCGCAGVFCEPTAVSAYAQVFEDEHALERLEGFMSLHGAAFYGLQPNEERITLVKKPWTPPKEIETPDGPVHVFLGGETLNWQIAA
ncbi:MAG: dihydroorotase [Patescibacteria group bacterium]